METMTRRLAVVLVLAILLPTQTRAQHLLNVTRHTFNRPAVQKELKLQPGQIEQAVASATSMFERMGEAGDELRKTKDSKAWKRRTSEIEQDYGKRLGEILGSRKGVRNRY